MRAHAKLKRDPFGERETKFLNPYFALKYMMMCDARWGSPCSPQAKGIFYKLLKVGDLSLW